MQSIEAFVTSLPYLSSAFGQGIGIVFLVFAGILIILGLVGSMLPESADVGEASALLVRTGIHLAIGGCAILAGGLLMWSTLADLPAARLAKMGDQAFVVGAVTSTIGIVLFKLTEMRSTGNGDGRALAIIVVGCLIMVSGASTVFIA